MGVTHNHRRRSARSWIAVAVGLLVLQVSVFLYLPIHFFNDGSTRVADFLILFLVPVGGFAARLLHAALPASGLAMTRNGRRMAGLLALLVLVAFTAGLAAVVQESDHALRLILANFAIALPLTSISISEEFKRRRNGWTPKAPT